MKLFCLPYAGGSSVIYSSWKRHINRSIDIYPIELAGRGKRYNDLFYNTMDEAVEDIYTIIEDKIKEHEEYAFFGHSMGSILVYEVCHKIQKNNIKQPCHIFFSGHGAPHIKKECDQIYHLPDEEFKKEILNLGGTPKEIFENEELANFVLPILRTDFKIIGNYEYKHEDGKLKSNITVLNGKEDELNINEIASWRNHTLGDCKIHMFRGGHFFINDNVENICNIINTTMKQVEKITLL